MQSIVSKYRHSFMTDLQPWKYVWSCKERTVMWNQVNPYMLNTAECDRLLSAFFENKNGFPMTWTCVSIVICPYVLQQKTPCYVSCSLTQTNGPFRCCASLSNPEISVSVCVTGAVVCIQPPNVRLARPVARGVAIARADHRRDQPRATSR